MNLSEISIRKPVFAWMLMASILLFGGIAFQRLGVSQLPDVDFPIVNINVDYEGAAPELIEAELIEPIEGAVMTVEGVKNIDSSSRTGRASVTVEFELDKDINVAVQEIQSAVNQVSRRFPTDVEPPTVSKRNPEDQPILWFTVYSDTMAEKELNYFVFSRIKDQFSTVEGVSEVFLGGYVDPSLRVWVSSKKLDQYALTVGDVVSTIQNEHSELPAGRIESVDSERNVRTMGEALTVDDFANLSINRRGGSPNFTPISLDRVAKVEEGLDDVRRKSRAMGKPAIGVGIKKQRNSNAVAVARAAKARMEEVKKTLPEGVHMAVNFDSTKFIEESIHELNFTLLMAAILTSLVCWLFLGSWSATLNVILSIPVSIVGSFFVLYWLGFTLNSFTLLALSLAIGIVVDDAIMVLENISRYRERGESRVNAALIGSREITFAAMAATAAVIAIFLPVAFMEGIIGKYFYQFGVTLSVAVALSLVEALTLTPMRCSQFLDVGERTTRIGRFMEFVMNMGRNGYARSLDWVLRHRAITLAGGVIFFAASLLCVRGLKSEFLPAQDQGTLMMRVQTPVGSSLAFTDKRFQEVEKIASSYPELERYYGAIGGFGGGEVNTGVIFLTFKPYSQRPVDPTAKKRLTQKELADKLREQMKSVPETRVTIQDLSVSGFGARRGFPIEFTVRGPEWDVLVKKSEELMKSLEDSGKMLDVDSNYKAGMPEIQVIPDRDKARRRGVSIVDLNQTISAMVGGVVAGKYSQGGRRYDVRVRLVPEERTQMEDILKLYVRNNRGELIRLSEVVTLKENPSLQAIYHQDRERAITIYGNMGKGVSQSEAIAAVHAQAKKTLPDAYRVVMSGSAQTYQESFRELIFALLLGVIVSYMILASQFNSFIHPVTVLLALPFSVSGAFIALLVGGQSINLFSMIGLILLMGIVKKNSILLVDFTNQVRADGKNARDALLQACPTRFRPIIMTSVSTIAAAIPAALAIGPGAEVTMPMALAVIGGVLVSTLLTLYIVPAFYSVVSRDGKMPQASPVETPTRQTSRIG